MEIRKFIRAAAGVGTVGLIDRAFAVGMGVLFARWLGPADFGVYSFVVAAIGILLLPARLGLPELLTRDIAASRGSNGIVSIRQTIFKGYYLVTIAAITIVFICYFLLELFPRTELSHYMKVGLWLILPCALFEVTIGILRGFGRIFAYQVYATLLMSLSILLFSALAFYLLDGYEAVIAINSRIAAVLFMLLLAFLHLWRVLHMQAANDAKGGRRAAELVKMGFGFMLNALIYMALMRVDLLILGMLADEESVGLYRVAVEGGMLVAFAYGTATTVLAPEYARLFAAGNIQKLQILVRKTARVIMLAGGFIAIILIFFSKEIIGIVFGPEYVKASSTLSILAFGHFITFFFGDPVYILNMTGHHSKITFLVSFGLVISIVLSLILIPTFGILGAGITASVVLVIYRALAFLVVYKTLSINCGVFGRPTVSTRIA